ncbi:hypothetical protein ACTHGU_13570 [Chitinophagaceae bacterium MMS25-I14]
MGSDSLLSRQYQEAQIANQKAQAAYYTKQANPMTALLTSITPIIGTLLASLIGFISIIKQSEKNSKAEDERWQRTQNAELQKMKLQKNEEDIKNVTTAAANLMKETAIATQSLTWILWIAKHDPETFNVQTVNEHDTRMNKIYSDIASAQVVLSAYSKAGFQKTEPIIKKVYDFDAAVAKRTRLLGGDKDTETVANLGSMWWDVYQFSLKLPSDFADALEIAITQKA